MGTYTSQAITGYKKSIAHNAIKMTLEQSGMGWEGDATTGFRHSSIVPYPGLTGNTLPPVTGPTGVVQMFVSGSVLNGSEGLSRDPGTAISGEMFPPGTRIVREEEVDRFPGYVLECDPWNDFYQPWLTRIESALEGWETIPDHARFGQEAEKAKAALQELTPTSGFGSQNSEEWRPTFDDPNRTNAFDLFSEYVGADVESDMIYAFRSKYGPTRVRTVLQNQGQIALGLTLVLGGEKQLWHTAGEDIMALCEAAKKAFNHQPPDFDFDIDLKVVKAFLDLAGVFVPPNIKPVVVGASAVVGFLQAVIPEDKAEPTPPPPLSAGTAEEVAAKFEEALLTLRRAVFDQEEELYRCTTRLHEAIMEVPPDHLHIHPGAGLAPGVTTTEQINVHTGALKDVGNHQIPVIAAVFAHAADDTYGLAPVDVWTRGWPLGYGTRGPQEDFAQIVEWFDQVATGSARELVDAGRRLAIAAGWLEGSDEENSGALTGLEDELGRGQTGWEQPEPEPALPPGVTID